MHNVLINMGSNIGNRRLNLSRAMRRVGMEFGPFEMSHVVETEPWGFDSGKKFLNVALMFATDETPDNVLARLQKIEHELSDVPHRAADGSYTDREIDIDIMAIDDLVISTPGLTVPHPCLARRRFFLEPLAEIAPGWRHPLTGMNADEMLRELARAESPTP